MNWFKRTWVAVLLAVIAVFASTLLSVNIKFTNKFNELIDGFYSGYSANESSTYVREKGIASYIRDISSSAKGLSVYAVKYGGADMSAELLNEIENMKNAFEDSGKDIAQIGFCYEELIKDVRTVQSFLASQGLTEQDGAAVNQCNEEIAEAMDCIKNSSYNEKVREFRSEYDKFPVSWLADNYFLEMPDYFS